MGTGMTVVQRISNRVIVALISNDFEAAYSLAREAANTAPQWGPLLAATLMTWPGHRTAVLMLWERFATEHGR